MAQKIDGIAHDSVHSNFRLQVVRFYVLGDSFSADPIDPLRGTSEALIIFLPLLLKIANSGKVILTYKCDSNTVVADSNTIRNRKPTLPSH